MIQRGCSLRQPLFNAPKMRSSRAYYGIFIELFSIYEAVFGWNRQKIQSRSLSLVKKFD